MLQSRNLDDQAYEDIVAYAVGRLPWLCPEWTNHNASDPGITIIELMAWYKEMQQYHMNNFTDEMRRKLLLLLNTAPRPASAAVCGIELTDMGPERYPELTRLATREGIVFELTEEIPAEKTKLAACLVDAGGTVTDISELVTKLRIGIQPFRFGGAGQTELLLGFDAMQSETLRLWFEIDTPDSTPRNDFTSPEQTPREIRWSCGDRELAPLRDDTHALSRSGYVTFPVPENWKTASPGGAPEARYLRAQLTDRGCEGEVRIRSISACRYPAVQCETWARTCRLTVERSASCEALFGEALAENASFAVFLRSEGGWEQITDFEVHTDGARRGVRFNSGAAAEDGAENLMVVCADPIHYYNLFFDSDGRPGMTLPLALGGSEVLTEQFHLICDTFGTDGRVRPAVWHCVDDLCSAGPRDRVFVYDPVCETVTFGDGLHGAIVPRGKAAVLAADLVLSHMGGGNIPEGESLTFERDGRHVRNTAASGGAERESVSDAAARFLKKLGHPGKCVCARDYEDTARGTPGLRVAAAKAFPGYDPSEPSGSTEKPVVTIVVIPGSGDERPTPDRRFLEAVQAHMDRRRPICTVVRVTAPRYVGIGLSVQITTGGAADEAAVRRCAEDYFALGPGRREIGDAVCKNDLAAALQRLPGVLKVGRIHLRSLSANCYCTAAGDISVPKNAVAWLAELDIDFR